MLQRLRHLFQGVRGEGRVPFHERTSNSQISFRSRKFERPLRGACTKVPMGVVEAVNGNIKTLLRRGRGYRDLNYLLLKAQRLAAIKTQFLVFQKAA